MIETPRIYKLIHCLDADERNRFPNWLANELRGKQKKLVIWMKQLWIETDFEQAWSAAFPKETYNETTVSRLNFELGEWIEEFMAIEAFRKDSFAKSLYLNRFVVRRSAEDLYPTTIKKSRKRLISKDQPIRDYTFFRIQYELDRLDAEFRNLYPGSQIRRYPYDPEAIQKHETLQIVLSQIELALRRLGARQVLSPFDRLAYEQLLTYKGGPSVQIAEIYLLLFDYLDNSNILSTSEGLDLINQYKASFSCLRSDARFTTAIHIQNLLVRSIHKVRRSDLLPVLSEFYAWMLEHGDVFANRYYYQNLIQTCLDMAKRDEQKGEQWTAYMLQAQDYLHQFKDKLPLKDREEAFQYNLAQIQFAEGAFEKLTKQHHPVEFRDYTYEVNYLILWNKAHYEMGDLWNLPERLKNLYDSVRKSQQLHQRYRRRLLNQIGFFRKMILATRKGTLSRLAEEIRTEPNLSGRAWLLAKIQEKADAH